MAASSRLLVLFRAQPWLLQNRTAYCALHVQTMAYTKHTWSRRLSQTTILPSRATYSTTADLPSLSAIVTATPHIVTQAEYCLDTGHVDAIRESRDMVYDSIAILQEVKPTLTGDEREQLVECLAKLQDCFHRIVAAERGRLQVGVFHDDERRSTAEREIEMKLPEPAEADTDSAKNS
eukprot:m.53290 g.53290  ORF g.53290 m.53290 type:complete len:178 (+) comp13549_c0_seq1:943-1476(+)